MTSSLGTFGQAGFLAPGTRLGNCELIRGLAVGGMADLYLARPLGARAAEAGSPPPVVALKRILPHFGAQPEYAAMFLDEARLVASLGHDNIARVYEIGNSPHGLFFTMEYVDGCDARQLLRRLFEAGEQLPLEHAVAIAIGAAAGLHAAHEQRGPDGANLGVVHRDVSPANVLVSRAGGVKLIDFGIAKARRRRVQTRDGTVKGKLAYMSPEQCLGNPIDRRTDVFSLGILLYELTTSRRLYSAPSEYAIMEQIAYQDAARPSAARPDCPPQLEAVVMRALARDPAARWPTAHAFQRALQAFAAGAGLVLSPGRLGAFVTAAFAGSRRDDDREDG